MTTGKSQVSVSDYALLILLGEMRQEQAKVAKTNSNTCLIRNSDFGEWNDIHPLDKKTLGKRAAEATLENLTY